MSRPRGKKKEGAASRAIKQRHGMSSRSSQALNARGIHGNVNLTVQVTTERLERGRVKDSSALQKAHSGSHGEKG